MDAFFTGNVSGKRVRLLPAGLCNWSDERGKMFGTVTKLFILILRKERAENEEEKERNRRIIQGVR